MIGQIENAILTRIRSASDQDILGYRLRQIKSYGGEFSSETDLRKQAQQLPAVFVTYQEEESDEETNESYRMKASFDVIIIAQNKRNEQAARHGGTTGEIGSYQIRRDILTLLAGQSFGLEIDELKPVSIRRELDTKLGENLSLSLIIIRFETAYFLPRAPNPKTAELSPGDATGPSSALSATAGVGSFTHLHIDWDVPPDTDSNATTDLNLEGAV
jgi:phage gp37-like protein